MKLPKLTKAIFPSIINMKSIKGCRKIFREINLIQKVHFIEKFMFVNMYVHVVRKNEKFTLT